MLANISRIQRMEQSVQSLQKQGRDNGLFGGNVKVAMSAFSEALQVLDNFLVEEEEDYPMDEGQQDVQVQKDFLRAQILNDIAKIKIMLCEWNDAYTILKEALEIVEPKIIVDKSDIKRALLVVDIYAGLSVADSHLSQNMREVNTWDRRALQILRKLQSQVQREGLSNGEDDSKLKYFLATFLNFITLSESDKSKQLSLYAEAIGLLTEVIIKFPNDLLFKRRLAHLYRNQSFALKETRRLEESRLSAERAIDIATDLIIQNPKAPNHYYELYHDHMALISCLEGMPDIDRNVESQSCLLDANERAAEAVTHLVGLLPSVPQYWNYLTDTLLDISELYEQKNEAKYELETLVRAEDSAQRSVELLRDNNNKKNEADLLLYQSSSARVLSNFAHLLCRNKKYKDSLCKFDQLHTLYTEHILCHPDCMKNDDDFYVESCIRTLDGAYNCALQAKMIDRALFFMTEAAQIGRKVKSRKNKQYHATILYRLGELHLTRKQYQNAIKCFQEQLSAVEPLCEKHPWHYFLQNSYASAHDGMARVHQAWGNQEIEIEHRRKFLMIHADIHGKDFKKWWCECLTTTTTSTPTLLGGKPTATSSSNKNSTNNNIFINTGGPNHNGQHLMVDMDKLRTKCKYDNLPSTKKFTLRCFFPKANRAFQHYSVYITSAIPGKDPLENQARVLKEDSGGIITLDARIGFRKLQALALKNNRNFQDLCEYAFDQGCNQIKTTNSSNSSQGTHNNDDESTTSKKKFTGHKHYRSIGSDCCICMETLHVDDSDTLPCGHGYHYNCILEWVDRSSACPLCRTEI